MALQAGRIGTWDWNLTTGKIVWSSRHEALWGMAPGTFKGTYEEFEARLHPDDRDGVKRATARAIAERSNFHIEYRVIWPDGSVHWIAGKGEPLFDDAGQPVRMIGVVMDITERKQAEEALRRSETASSGGHQQPDLRFAGVLTPEGIFVRSQPDRCWRRRG
ncbi:MAG: PAS domain-containing protein [Candidatus Manganitrophus sp.]|nr:PAS domain-containing protein [Candidatus Manganitrophus sp.]